MGSFSSSVAVSVVIVEPTVNKILKLWELSYPSVGKIIRDVYVPFYAATLFDFVN